jgi:TRAP-type mannitol/chloroaromatic compound transport system permease large subunit
MGALVMAGLRAGAPRRLLLPGAAALVMLAIAVALFPVRLQRSDLTLLELAAGVIYLLLAAVGAGAILAALRRLTTANIVQEALDSTLAMTAMIFATILAAGMFSLVFVGLGGEERVTRLLEAMPGGPTGALVFAMLVVFVLGFFLDFVEIAVIVLPVALPPLILMGHDPIWLGALFAINLQTSFLTPPFGFSLFYLRGAAPAAITTGHIYRGVLPFIGLQAIGVLLVWLFSPLATWLPKVLF